MKNLKSKKGFSLIELIVVIAVIAAIAAIIIPSISNFSSKAKESADTRNAQLWNATYLNCRAAGIADASITGCPADAAAYASGDAVPGISGAADIDGDGTNDITFSADGFTLQSKGYTFGTDAGLE